MSSVVIDVEDPSQVAVARRGAIGPADAARLSDAQRANLLIVVTELATNLLKHAGRGRIVIGAAPAAGAPTAGVHVLALDRGPGIADVPRALRDGYSTAGSPGTGLGAVERLSSRLDIYSTPGAGTAILVVVAPDRRAESPPGGVDPGGVCAAMAGEVSCGDAWSVAARPGAFAVLVADGLGHGPLAADAAQIAVRVFHRHAGMAPAPAIAAVHEALRSTRGAAVAIADVDIGRGLVRFCGVGNIAGSVVSPEHERHLVSLNGTAGQGLLHPKEFSYPWSGQSTLVMHTDGLQSRWDLSKYPGLLARHPALIAGVLFRDFERGRDDCTVMAARERRS